MHRIPTMDPPPEERRRAGARRPTPNVPGIPLADGDVSVHLEDLVVGQLPPLETLVQTAVDIELVGPHLRVSGSMLTGYHRRVSDFVNHHQGLLHLYSATVLRRTGEATKVTMPSMWVSPSEVTLLAETRHAPANEPVPPEFRVSKVRHTLIVVTSGHTMTGNVHIAPGAELAGFIESADPAFIPMTDVRTRSLADRRVIARYPFALLNRRHVVAATQLQPGMIPGRAVL